MSRDLSEAIVEEKQRGWVRRKELPYVDVTLPPFNARDDWNGSTGTDNTNAIKAALAYADSLRLPVLFRRTKTGAFLVRSNLIDGSGTLLRYALHGTSGVTGANSEAAEPGYSSVRIVYRPDDTSIPMIRCYRTTNLLGMIGPYEHCDLHFDFGDAHGMVFGVEDPDNPTVVAPVSPPVSQDGVGQSWVFNVSFKNCALRATNATRARNGSGVIARSGRRMISMTKAFESSFDTVSLSGSDTQIRTYGCDRPRLVNIRSQHSHLPFDFEQSQVPHALSNIQVEGWTFTPIRTKGCEIQASNTRFEQVTGISGHGRYSVPGTVSVTDNSGSLTWSQSMDGILFPFLSILEITSGSSIISALVTAVSGTSVTIETSTTTVFFTDPVATAKCLHGYGPLHLGTTLASYSQMSPGAALNCPAGVYMLGRGSMVFNGVCPEPGSYGDIRCLVIGNRHGDQSNLHGAMVFNGCNGLFAPNGSHPFVAVSGLRASLNHLAPNANSRIIYGSFDESILPLRRQWAFTPKSAQATNLSSRRIVVRVAEESNTSQETWCWLIRSGESLNLHDTTLPSLSSSQVRIRVRARSVSGSGTLNLLPRGSSSGSAIPLALSNVMQDFELIVPVFAAWQGTRTASGYVGFGVTIGASDTVYLAGVLVEEISPVAVPNPRPPVIYDDSHTLVALDSGRVVVMESGSSNDLTVPPDSAVAFAIGTTIPVVQGGSGVTTIVAGSGVTIHSLNSNLAVGGQYAEAVLRKTGVNEWLATGDLS